MHNKMYMLIYEQVKKDIIEGRFARGSKIPSKRSMAESMGVSVITVEHAYELLDEEGFITAKEKSGYYVTFDAGDMYYDPVEIPERMLHGPHAETGFRELALPSTEPVREGTGGQTGDGPGPSTGLSAAASGPSTGLSAAAVGPSRGQTAALTRKPLSDFSSESTGGTQAKADDKPAPPSISSSLYARTVRRVLTDHAEEIMQRSPMKGVAFLREVLARYLDRGRRIQVSPEQIIIGAGAEYLYGLIVQAMGRNVLYGIESPSYQKIAKVYESGGADIRMLRLGNDGIESSDLWESRVDVLHITPYRSFPSGVTASAAKKLEYLRWSQKNRAVIIEDDFESEFTPSRKPEETLFSMDKNAQVIYVNTFTRTIGPYIRAAYMVIPETMEERFREKVGFYECPVPALDQYILAEFIHNGDFERHINRVRRYNRRVREE